MDLLLIRCPSCLVWLPGVGGIVLESRGESLPELLVLGEEDPQPQMCGHQVRTLSPDGCGSFWRLVCAREDAVGGVTGELLRTQFSAVEQTELGKTPFFVISP